MAKFSMQEWEQEEHTVTLTNAEMRDIVSIASWVADSRTESRETSKAGDRIEKKFFSLYDYLTSQDHEDDKEQGKDVKAIIDSLWRREKGAGDECSRSCRNYNYH